CCSTPTHAAETAVSIDVRVERARIATLARRLEGNARRTILERARALTHLARAPQQQVTRHRHHLHQLLRELRASARRTCGHGRTLADAHLLVLGRGAARAAGPAAAKRHRDLERLGLALAALVRERTLA